MTTATMTSTNQTENARKVSEGRLMIASMSNRALRAVLSSVQARQAKETCPAQIAADAQIIEWIFDEVERHRCTEAREMLRDFRAAYPNPITP